MNRVAFGAFVLILTGIGLAMFAPATDEWRIACYVAFFGGAGSLVALLAYRIFHEGKGENIVAEVLTENSDGGDH